MMITLDTEECSVDVRTSSSFKEEFNFMYLTVIGELIYPYIIFCSDIGCAITKIAGYSKKTVP